MASSGKHITLCVGKVTIIIYNVSLLTELGIHGDLVILIIQK